jgi:hypothetical protein
MEAPFSVPRYLWFKDTPTVLTVFTLLRGVALGGVKTASYEKPGRADF